MKKQVVLSVVKMQTHAVLLEIISVPRLSTYQQETGFDTERALALYAWNMKVSAAFMPLFAATEISLRNLVCGRLNAVFGAEWWQDTNFQTLLGGKGKGIVKRAEKVIQLRGHTVDSGRMTAELSFGFWEKMLLVKYEQTLWSPLHPSFPDLPIQIDLSSFANRCGEICDLRNRVSHHEPIFREDLSKKFAENLEFLRWLSPAKARWIRPHCEVMALMRRKP